VGRRIWILAYYAGIPLVSGPFRVQSFKKFLPAGKYVSEKNGQTYETNRKQSLVQLWTDGGMRTAAVATIWSKDPGKSPTPW
jgi:hypothetical protein